MITNTPKKEECYQFLSEEFIFPHKKSTESVPVDSDPADEYKISSGKRN